MFIGISSNTLYSLPIGPDVSDGRPHGRDRLAVEVGLGLPEAVGQPVELAVVRAAELGSFAFPDSDRPELVRLAIPRRTYGADHLEHVAETFGRIAERSDAGEISGLEIVEEPAMAELRHFSAELQPVEQQEATADD